MSRIDELSGQIKLPVMIDACLGDDEDSPIRHLPPA